MIKQRATFLHQIKSEQSDLQAMKEAYEDIQQKCSDMTLKANSQGNQTEKQEVIKSFSLTSLHGSVLEQHR